MKWTFEMCRRIDQIVQSNGDIYIRCAGNIGKQLCFELKSLGINVTAFLDIDSTGQKEIMGIPILSPEIIYKKESGTYFVLVAIKDDSIFDSISQEYFVHGLKKGIDYGDFSFVTDQRMQDFTDIRPEYDFRKRFERIAVERMGDMRLMDPNFNTALPDAYNLIPNLDVPLTTFCSMSCEFCSHCIPYAKPPKHGEVDEIVESLDRLLSVSYVACIGVMGGEPFVFPRIADFIREYKKMKNFENIGFTRVVTNGTIVPSSDFFEEYKDVPNAYIYISNYGEKSKKINELVNRCEEYGIKTYVCPYSDEWMLLGDVRPRRNYSDDEIRHLYAVCGSHSCVQLLNNRVYACGRVPVLNEYGVIPFSDNDYCEVYGDGLNERLHKYLYEKEYLDGCQYCDGQHDYSKRIHRGE